MRRAIASIVAGACLFIVGCSRGPASVHRPDFDPQEASEQAVQQYDANGDGELSEQELAACPGILYNLTLYDIDGNKKVSIKELEQRLRDLRTANIGLTKLTVEVRQNGRPLQGAEVKLVPEAYLGTEVKPARGKTSARGSAIMDIPDSELPASDKGLIGVHYGTYKVEITHPTISIPAKYNSQTTLGYETQRGNPQAKYELSSR
jgi:hypothetical protein